jgi:hypothetical protein
MYLQLSGEVVSGIQFRDGMDITPTHYAKSTTSPSSPCCFVGDLFCMQNGSKGLSPPSIDYRTRATDYIIFLTTVYYIILL